MADYEETEKMEQLITDEQLEEIRKTAEAVKKANPKVRKVLPIVVMGGCDDEKPIYVGYFRQPAFIAFSKYMNIVQKDSIGAMKELAKDSFLSGDRDLLDDDSLFLYGLMPQLTSLIEVRKAQLVNLSKAGK